LWGKIDQPVYPVIKNLLPGGKQNPARKDMVVIGVGKPEFTRRQNLLIHLTFLNSMFFGV